MINIVYYLYIIMERTGNPKYNWNKNYLYKY